MESMITNFDSLSEEDLSKYAGEWIAVIDGKIVIHSKLFEEVYKYTKTNFPSKKPLIGKIPENIPIVLSLT